MECACGCKQQLTGKATKWFNDDHKNAFNTKVRRLALGRGLSLSEPEGIPGLLPRDAGKILGGLGQYIGSALQEKTKRQGMHTGTLNCKTYQAILTRLDRGPATTLELHEASGSMATSTDVSAINKLLLGSGKQIVCQYKGKFNDRKVFEYSLVKVA